MHAQVAEQAHTQAQAMVATQDAGGAQSAGPGPDSAVAAQQSPGEVPLTHDVLPLSGHLCCFEPCHPAVEMFSSLRYCIKAGHATGLLHPGASLLGGGVTELTVAVMLQGHQGLATDRLMRQRGCQISSTDVCPPCSSSTRSALSPCAVQHTFLPGCSLHPCLPGGHSWHSCMLPLLQPACSSMGP